LNRLSTQQQYQQMQRVTTPRNSPPKDRKVFISIPMSPHEPSPFIYPRIRIGRLKRVRCLDKHLHLHAVDRQRMMGRSELL
jgi:hypothetical protein